MMPLAAFVAPILLILFLLFLYSVAEVLLLFFVGVLFAIYLGAITDGMQSRLGMPRRAGLATALLITVVVAVGAGYLIVPPLVQQTRDMVEFLPALVASWDRQLIALAQRSTFAGQVLGPLEPGGSYVGGFVNQIAGYLSNAIPYLFTGVRFIIYSVAVLVMGIYLSLRPAVYRDGFVRLVPPVHRDLVLDILAELGRTLRAWVVGQLIGMVVLGVLMWVGLELLGVPYALAFGVFTAVIAIVPFFGTLFAVLLPVLFVLGTGELGRVLLVLALGVAVQLLESNVVQPMIMERQVRLPPVLSILAVLIMASLLDLIGVFVAVPVLCVVMVLVRRVYVYRILEGHGFRRAIRDQPVELRLTESDGVLVHPAARERSVPSMLED